MRIAIITEKPYVASLVGPLASMAFPADNIVFPVFLPVPQYGVPLPRGLSWGQYPHIAPFELEGFSPRHSARFMLGPTQPKIGQFKEDVELFEGSLQQADKWIVLCQGHELFDIDVASIRLRGQKLQPQEVSPLNSLDKKTIEGALVSNGTPSQQLQDWISYGHVRRYFDHQFALNSLAVLCRTLDYHCWISKYQIQLLYWLSQAPLSTVQLYNQARYWKGTGKYNFPVSLGSTMSMTSIVSQLMDKGWIHESDNFTALTDVGKQVISSLHPRCQDLDLPFRIHAWARSGLEESRPAIDKYIRTFFGRQKRFWENHRSS